MNSLTFSVLRRLADGEFHSGEAIAQAYGVSRASVWNALRGLDQFGIEVFKIRGRGYRLAQPLILLTQASVMRELGEYASRFAVEVVDRTASTNSLLLERAQSGAPHASVIAAEWQTHGRGRFGRVWHAMPGSALAFSLLWRFQQGAGFLAGLSLAVGLAVTRVLTALGVPEAGLKWPNDVVWRGGKLAGILIEMHGDVLGPSAVVIGVGLNCRLPAVMRERIDQPATDLQSACGTAPDRNHLLAVLLVELERILSDFARDGFAAVRDEWQARHVFQRQAVRLDLPSGGTITGTVQGVGEDGALLLATENGQRRFYGGEVSLRQR